jgi:hypothetical protein
VRLIATTDIPVQAILRETDSLLGINFISWNKAYSIFPGRMFPEHSTIRPLMPKLGSANYLDCCEWFVELLSSRPRRRSEIGRKRRVGDRCCWMIALDTLSIVPSSTPDYVLESCSFRYLLADPSYGRYSIFADVFRSSVLQYRYGIPVAGTLIRNSRKSSRFIYS